MIDCMEEKVEHTTVTTYLPTRTVAALDKIAATEERSRTSVIRRILNRHVNEYPTDHHGHGFVAEGE